MSAKNKKKTPKFLWVLLIAAVLILAVLLLQIPSGEENTPGETFAAVTVPEETEGEPLFLLDDALRVDKIGEYTGIYVEDGSDDAVTGLLMMLVTNITADPIQYAEITLDLGDETARFAVSVLPAGGTAVLIEQNRMEFDADLDYTAVTAQCTGLAGFDRKLTLHEDKLMIQLLDGGVNIKNISGEDIAETVVLYYKNISNGVYHGGIAYRVRLEGGLKADELRQIMVDHIHNPGTELMFVDLIS